MVTRHGGGAVVTVDGAELLYAKANLPGIFARSLSGDLAANPERQLVDDNVPPIGVVLVDQGRRASTAASRSPSPPPSVYNLPLLSPDRQLAPRGINLPRLDAFVLRPRDGAD